MVVIKEDDSGSISIDRRLNSPPSRHDSRRARCGEPEVSVENVPDSDSDLTDLDDFEEGMDDSNIVETEGTEKSINLQVETESGRTRIVQTDRSNQFSMEKQLNAIAMSGRTGKTAWQASAEQAI